MTKWVQAVETEWLFVLSQRIYDLEEMHFIDSLVNAFTGFILFTEWFDRLNFLFCHSFANLLNYLLLFYWDMEIVSCNTF